MRRIIITIFTLLFVIQDIEAQIFSDNMELVNLGKKVNTGYHEAGPIISPDGRTLYFFVHNHPDNTYGKEGSQDVWYAQKNDQGEWGAAVHMDRPINVNRSNQVFAVLNDGATLLIRGGSSKNSRGFSYTYRRGGDWSNPDEIDVDDLRKMNLGKYYGATISTDARIMIMYFSEKENGTFSDLYISRSNDGKEFNRPVKIPGLNTGRDEFAPFLGPDNKTLYFSSGRKDMGKGSADIYVTHRLDDSWLKWSVPENLGEPVNTRAFDAYLCVDTHDNIFVTQSGRTIDGGNLDIFSLQKRMISIKLQGIVMDSKDQSGLQGEIRMASEEALDTLFTESGRGIYKTTVNPNQTLAVEVLADGYQPLKTEIAIGDIKNDTTLFRDFLLEPNERAVMLTGVVYNSETMEPVRGVVQMESNGSGHTFEVRTNEKGYFEKELEDKGLFVLIGKSEGYLNSTDSIENQGDETMLVQDLYLDPIAVGATVRLNNIFFDFDKTTLKPESYKELNIVVDFLESNPGVSIEIAGHTDNKGSDEYNLQLSQGRSEAVVNYLIDQGIEENRIDARGYGEGVPVASNDTDEGRAINRRVEFTILSTEFQARR